jgi:hypothetical protein
MQGPKEKANKRKLGRPPKTSSDIDYPTYKHRSLPHMVGTQNELMDPPVKAEVMKTVFSSALDIKIKKNPSR